MYYRNGENGQFICWNACQRVVGNQNGKDTVELRLAYPIVASEVRIYPLEWTGNIWISV